MLKKIKNFFKWIADHTGISWVVKKNSSGWNGIKNWWSGQSHKNSLIELIKGTSDYCAVVKENGSKQLVLHVAKKNIPEIMDWRNINCKDPSTYYVYVKCDKAVFKIAYSERVAMSDNSVSFIVDSVENDKTSSHELEGMKRMLGLNSKRTVGTITQISQKPAVASSASKVPANDGKALSLETDKPSKLLDNLSKEQLMWSRIIVPQSLY